MSLWNITRKDLYLLIRDRRTFAILLLLPLLFIIIIGMTTGQLLGWKNSNQTLKIAFIDRTNYEAIGSSEFLATQDEPQPEPLGQAARREQRRIAKHLVAYVFNGVQKTAGVKIRPIADWSTTPVDPDKRLEVARRLLSAREGGIDAILVFQPDFYQRVYHLEPTNRMSVDPGATSAERFEQLGMAVLTGDSSPGKASAISAMIGINTIQVLNPLIACRSMDATIAQRGTARYRAYCGPVNDMARTDPPELLDPSEAEPAQKTGSVYDELVPSYTVMFVFFLVNIMARSFLTEREMGTLRRLRIAPVRQSSILLGKTLPFLVVSLIQTVLLFTAGRLLFGMSWGSHPAMLLPVIVTTSLAATGMGLMIATLVTSDSQVSAYATTAVILLAGISGCFMPRQWLPETMQTISLVTPHAWALIAYNELLGQPVPDLLQVWKCAGMLALFAVAFFLGGALRFRAAN